MSKLPRPDYPRPQFQRNEWINLNGIWQFEFDDHDVGIKEEWFHGKDFSRGIRVPFAYQSQLSGIGEVEFHDIVWYKRTFHIPSQMNDQLIFLHFGAVDYRAWVWINGQQVCFHEGGHVPFHAEITPFLREGENEVVVRAEDPSDALDQPRGKQYWKEESESIFYTRTTGIWQTVWLEAVSPTHLERVWMTPDIDRDEIVIEYQVRNPLPDDQLEIAITFDGNPVATELIQLHHQRSQRAIRLNDFHVHHEGRIWSPEHPHLYDVTFTLRRNGVNLDQVKSYFGMRKISIEQGRICLNNRPYYMKLVLDQGYFPDGLLTPPSDEAIRRDVQLTKEMGFNGVRKHQKVEDPRYLYWADRLGLLVWGEMANSYTYSTDGVRRMTQEWQQAVERDYNHPSVVVWVPINESWGVPHLLTDSQQQAHLRAMVHLTKSLDATRLVVSNDGWEHADSDLLTVHDYHPYKHVLKERYAAYNHLTSSLPAQRPLYIPGHTYQGEPIMVTEFGGIAYKKSDWEGWGYSGATDDQDFAERYEAVVSALLESPLVQGFCYTQLTDVEQEINGLLTYDRQPKINLDVIRKINVGKAWDHEKIEADVGVR
ncbi:glycoside hydrolase family 2 protein [Desmospora activa]|uniref:Glycosyl hydrolase family 2 n=1 Tax=Desmospora activa DSM 45169 TaxID=1121389 RepID=A0A2T4Z7I0_9BACL|nr:sugar-binding domain-containing protein [Desmospora activa]PTM57844.1 glycosyl hydrolase family 2 [Desmospora activa DSM 45169]